MPGYSNRRRIALVYPFCFLIPLLYLFSGCASSRNIYNKLSDTEYTSPDYRTMLERWTRRGSIHKGLKTELLVVATYKAEEFRRAYTEEYTRAYMLTHLQNKIMMDDQIKAADDYDDFLVSIYTQEKQWDDFSEKNSLWRVYLIRDGRFRTGPLEIRKVKKSRTLSESFYPFISPWSSIYIFRFKKKDQPKPSKSIELILTSAPGSTILKWEL